MRKHRIYQAQAVLTFVVGLSTAALPAQIDLSKRYTREQIQSLAIGKSREEAVKIFGKPSRVQSSGKLEHWEYRIPKVYDPITGTEFRWFDLGFWDGQCDSIGTF